MTQGVWSDALRDPGVSGDSAHDSAGGVTVETLSLARIHGAVRPGGRMASPKVAQHMVGKEYVRAVVVFLTCALAVLRGRDRL